MKTTIQPQSTPATIFASTTVYANLEETEVLKKDLLKYLPDSLVSDFSERTINKKIIVLNMDDHEIFLRLLRKENVHVSFSSSSKDYHQESNPKSIFKIKYSEIESIVSSEDFFSAPCWSYN